MIRAAARQPRQGQVSYAYTAAEADEEAGMVRAKIRRWITEGGLPATAKQKPWLIDGRELDEFLQCRNRAVKRPLGQGEFYCFSSQDRRPPDRGMVDYPPRTTVLDRLGDLRPTCGTDMFRASRKDYFGQLPASLEVAFPMAKTRLTIPATPNVNLKKGSRIHGKTQP